LSSSQEPRAQILLRVADDANVARAFRNRAFVTLQYFGYLHRDPEHPGYDLWLRLLDQTGDTSRVTASFVNSIEYRQRFF
jgi:DNA-binding IclR family transcriptional regulator